MRIVWRRRLLSVACLFLGLVLGCMSQFLCLRAWLLSGMVVEECPAGGVRETLSAYVSGLGRGQTGIVNVRALGHYTTGAADEDRSAEIGRLSAELSLVDSAGKVVPLQPEHGWDSEGKSRTAELRLPDVPDGDYLLRIEGSTPVGPSTLDVPLPLYAPARVHVLTDRPLYEPGNTVRFRALALRAKDLSPLDGRPGTWTVLDPSGEVLLEEKAPAGDWGVSSGSFPLDTRAATGDWKVRWSSGSAVGEATIHVAPFTLPRFRVEASADRPAWYIGERPTVHGRVVYSSGAPVAKAAMALDWSTDGEWPMPTIWTRAGDAQALPTSVVTDQNGNFNLTLPVVPGDLQGQAALRARITATDPAGDRVGGDASLLLSQDRVRVSAVTELGDGLVEGFNNRLYVRAETPWGEPLPGVKLTVQRAWDSTDAGTETMTDEDGVAALQVDPGPAVNVVIPAMPVRPPPPQPPVAQVSVNDQISGDAPGLDDRVALEGWDRALAPCARFVASGDQILTAGVAVSASGSVRAVAADVGALGHCAEQALQAQRLPAGKERFLSMSWRFSAADLPTITPALDGLPSTPDPLFSALQEAALDARSCLGRDQGSDSLPELLSWRTRADGRAVELQWAPDPKGGDLAATSTACVERVVSEAVRGVQLPEHGPATVGFARFAVAAVAGSEATDAQATTMLGYEFRVTAETTGKEAVRIGDTRLRLPPGQVPSLRLRATPVLPKAGDSVTVEILRGPDFQGELPDEMFLTHPLAKAIKAKVDKKERKASFTLPDDAAGWYSVDYGGASTRVFVRTDTGLDVALAPDRGRYAPGETATLHIETRRAGKGVAAGVGLVGVDQSLGQLVPLPEASALDGMRPQVQMSSPAFGDLDGQALTMGRIRGANASAATVLRVSQVPVPETLDVAVNTSADAPFTPLTDLTDHFYTVLAALDARTRAWEHDAPAGEQITPETMAKLWSEAVDDVASKGGDATDAYGRKLRLSALPVDLLALTDPRAVVVDGTRLPEDVENWSAWVEREQP